MVLNVELKNAKMLKVLNYAKVLTPDITNQELKEKAERVCIDALKQWAKGLRQQALQTEQKETFDELDDIREVV